jgi:TolA-binding protein
VQALFTCPDLEDPGIPRTVREHFKSGFTATTQGKAGNMNRLVTILLLSLATAVQAGEVKIIETETGIIAEYTGSPSSTVTDCEIPVAAAENDSATRVNFLTAEIEQLKREVAEILKLSGNETEDEQQAKEALAAEIKQRIECYEDEIHRMSGKPQTEAVQKPAPPSGTQRETIRRFKELRQSRKASSAGSALEKEL